MNRKKTAGKLTISCKDLFEKLACRAKISHYMIRILSKKNNNKLLLCLLYNGTTKNL